MVMVHVQVVALGLSGRNPSPEQLVHLTLPEPEGFGIHFNG